MSATETLPLAAADRIRWMRARDPRGALLTTDARGIVREFGPDAEAFFGRPADEVVGRLSYRDFHDAAQLEACRDDAAFRAAMRDPGWNEGLWTVVPAEGEPFEALVALAPLLDEGDFERSDEPPVVGWIALYRRADGT